MSDAHVHRLACRHCGMVLAAVGTWLSDDAVTMLREHLQRLHPAVALPADAQAGAVLEHYDVARGPT